MKGHIEIKDKVYFVYYELPKPSKNFCLNVVIHTRRMKEYEASKKTVEVSNVHYQEINSTDMSKENFIEIGYGLSKGLIKIKNNQPCEAEVTDNKATIIKIL